MHCSRVDDPSLQTVSIGLLQYLLCGALNDASLSRTTFVRSGPARSSVAARLALFIRYVHVVDLDMTPKRADPRAAWPMPLPNPSRIFDSTRRAVRFWGHDGAMEWSFFVTQNALKGLQPSSPLILIEPQYTCGRNDI